MAKALAAIGYEGGGVKKSLVNRSRLESGAREGDSPLGKNRWSP